MWWEESRRKSATSNSSKYYCNNKYSKTVMNDLFHRKLALFCMNQTKKGEKISQIMYLSILTIFCIPKILQCFWLKMCWFPNWFKSVHCILTKWCDWNKSQGKMLAYIKVHILRISSALNIEYIHAFCRLYYFVCSYALFMFGVCFFLNFFL